MPRTTHAAAALIAAASFAVPLRADTTMRVEVSHALAEDWHNSINASPGDSIDIRVLVSHTGDPVLGFSSLIFQPTISNWTATDTMLPLINGGAGGQRSTPPGAVQDLPGQYGRIIPYAAISFTNSSNFLRGHVNTVGGVSYLRIAQAHVTAWFNTQGAQVGGGVNMHQLNNLGRLPEDPPFSPATTNVVLFKFGITLDSSNSAQRTMIADVPLQGIYPGSTGFPYVGWFVSMEEPTGSFREQPNITGASIFVNVPAPVPLATLGSALALAARRRARPT
jgi:hypothetical protein